MFSKYTRQAVQYNEYLPVKKNVRCTQMHNMPQFYKRH